MKELCIDISTWQRGIDYEDIKRNCNYVVLRAGFDITEDNMFQEHYNNLSGQVHLGVYWYTYATNENEARNEARRFLELINGKQFDLPIYLDIEDSSISGLGRGTLDAIVRAFGTEIQNAGYYFGVYTNLNWYRNIISGSELNKDYDWWIALWDSEPPYPEYGINYGIWQFGSTNIGGQSVDGNYIYKDYPTIIRELGLNHLDSGLTIQGHVAFDGWLNPVSLGEWCGTRGESKQLEALKIDTEKAGFTIDEVALHIAFDGWKFYKTPSKDEVLGTTGEKKAIECIRIKALKEDGSPRFRFRVHQSMFGDTCWTLSDGISTLGSVGQSLPLEAIEIEEI